MPVRSTIVVAALVLGVSALQAQQPPAASKAGPLPAKVTVPSEYHKLENGLKVVLSRDSSSPTAVVGVYYAIGFRVEPKRCTSRPAVTPASSAMCASVSSPGPRRDMARCAAM